MSHTSTTDAQQKTVRLFEDELTRYTDEHGENPARALEAFIKSLVFSRAVQAMLSHAPASVQKPLGGLVRSHMAYQLGRYFDLLNLTEDQFLAASQRAEHVVECMKAISDSIDQPLQ